MCGFLKKYLLLLVKIICPGGACQKRLTPLYTPCGHTFPRYTSPDTHPWTNSLYTQQTLHTHPTPWTHTPQNTPWTPPPRLTSGGYASYCILHPTVFLVIYFFPNYFLSISYFFHDLIERVLVSRIYAHKVSLWCPSLLWDFRMIPPEIRQPLAFRISAGDIEEDLKLLEGHNTLHLCRSYNIKVLFFNVLRFAFLVTRQSPKRFTRATLKFVSLFWRIFGHFLLV